MRLKDWMKKNNINIPLLAKKLNISYSHLYKYFYGAKRISPDLATRIEELTKGEICREEAIWPEKFNPDYTYKKGYYDSKVRNR